mmetsp:Transcript_23984/g.51150  ORF Transcript_23984/g.51150 Transcript_23984/m.51150 type:complete len:137 (+) Transcript_23984:110-520(+)
MPQVRINHLHKECSATARADQGGIGGDADIRGFVDDIVSPFQLEDEKRFAESSWGCGPRKDEAPEGMRRMSGVIARAPEGCDDDDWEADKRDEEDDEDEDEEEEEAKEKGPEKGKDEDREVVEVAKVVDGGAGMNL